MSTDKRAGKKGAFHIASEEEIKAGKISDVYFQRGVQILRERNADKWVKGEVRASSLPEDWEWAVLGGIEETAHLLIGLRVDVEAMPEGTLFHVEEPVLTIEGNYSDFAIYETALLGLVCQASGVATKAARCKLAAGDRKVYSFGARRMHPAITPMVERNAFIGGCDGVAVPESARLIHEEPIGTMAHALILVLGSEEEAYRAFNEVIDSKVKRVALVDTFNDEKFAALRAAEVLGKDLFAVRLDTPRSRRGDFPKILEEVRWELNLRGHEHVKIFVSGGIDENKITKCNPHADAYGVGTAISNAPVVDFSFDLVEVGGKTVAKRGKMSGSKSVLRCTECFTTRVVPWDREFKKCACGGRVQSLLKTLIKKGDLVVDLPDPHSIRSYVLNQLAHISLNL
ncbi:MAG: nicotinate phosphoribosyltransferase [Actinomycetota bacterium]|nr:nicotinate phosphoribosyltransferase [Actinomycetota bacterium]